MDNSERTDIHPASKELKRLGRFTEGFQRYVLVIIVGWTISVALSSGWHVYHRNRAIVEMARIQARTVYNKDVLYRRWNAMHGGVYVPVTEKTQPNPYLAHVLERDITTPSGRRLTMMNPAYMSRQIYELEREQYDVRGHLTSLKPIRPQNAADPWEVEALQAFERGESEVSAIQKIGGTAYMRLMRPLITEEGCLKCHAAQGYKVGDIRGGISISVPMAPLWAAGRKLLFADLFGHGVLWILGVAMISWGASNLRLQAAALRESEERYRLLFNSGNDAIFVSELPQQGPREFVEVNDIACQRLGYSREELLQLSPVDINIAEESVNAPAFVPQMMEKFWAERHALFEAVHVTKDGRKIPVEVNSHLFDLHGQPTVLSIVRDITARKRAEEQLRVYQQQLEAQNAELRKLSQAVEQSASTVVITDLEGNIVYANPKFVETTGYTVEEALGQNPRILKSGEQSDDFYRELWETITSGREWRGEFHNKRKDGTLYWEHATIAPVYDAVGQMTHFIAVKEDITARKRAEEALRESEARYRELFESVPVGLYRTLPTGEIVNANQALVQMLGYPDRESLLKTDLVSLYTDPREIARWQALMNREGIARAFETQFRRHDGAVIWVRDSTYATRDSAGQVLCYDGVTEDITAHKRAEEQSRWEADVNAALSALYKPLISSPSAIEEITNTVLEQAKRLTGSVHGYVSSIDPITGDNVAHTLTEMLKGACAVSGENRRIVFPRGSDGRYHGLWGHALNTREAFYTNAPETHPASAGDPEGHIPLQRFLSVPVMLGAELVGQIALANPGKDYTERHLAAIRRMAEFYALAIQRKRYEEALARSNAELQQFAHVVSHDLQEPLRMVTSYLQLLEQRYKGKLDAAADDFIFYAVDGATRMSRLIKDLLKYSRVGTRSKEPAPTDCEQVLELALRDLKIAMVGSGAVVTHDPLPTVLADDVQLGQVFQNLIGNALKFHSAEPPRVHVTAERRGNEWLFSVRDNGIGIDPKDAERIFVIFQRLRAKDEYEGTGIGLAVCKKIVARHGGRIWVESQLGQGATFYFTLPMRTAD